MSSTTLLLEPKPKNSDPSRFRARLRAQLATLISTPAPLRSSTAVDALRCSRSASGFRNVYASGPGWIAKVKEHGRLFAIPGSRQPTPQQAASFVVAYYRMRFGEHWEDALAARKRTGWRVRYIERFNGWLLAVWVNGRKRRIKCRDDAGGVHLVFPSRVQAVEFARYWLAEHLKQPVWRGD